MAHLLDSSRNLDTISIVEKEEKVSIFEEMKRKETKRECYNDDDSGSKICITRDSKFDCTASFGGKRCSSCEYVHAQGLCFGTFPTASGYQVDCGNRNHDFDNVRICGNRMTNIHSSSSPSDDPQRITTNAVYKSSSSGSIHHIHDAASASHVAVGTFFLLTFVVVFYMYVTKSFRTDDDSHEYSQVNTDQHWSSTNLVELVDTNVMQKEESVVKEEEDSSTNGEEQNSNKNSDEVV
mmetsp:Transcript_26551/g.40183  ORF Transcript_26551/g.40183 Transcript_26551/m.40183 type:complete len:237 (-) Transcript_26551:165-875(-)|eukprot:CAMPEP_0178919358 /NCGR_PEP_ID=MMETSP0786-20121207/14387_1 /TAXON_ID=186022 /ORGANISM="Thalassionema frauenfeldii, Strain CCMP 1798" /LENGTH=236 /DNA_ID=CAMNT_0020593269 /DNA_START=35 /DNA_END=745 /DNA_ORIENTATION=-